MTNESSTSKLLQGFAARIFLLNTNYKIKEYEEAGEIITDEKTIYIQLYNGHFWDSTEDSVTKYLGPTARLAALFWLATERQDTEEFETFAENERKELGDLYHDRESFFDDDEEDDHIELRVKAYNALPIAPGIGERLMNRPEEWKERLAKGAEKWERLDRSGKTIPKAPPTPFEIFVTTIQETLGVRIEAEPYRDEKGEIYACDVHLGYDKEGDLQTARFVYHCGAFHDTNDCQLVEVLGCDPEIAGKEFCARLGYEIPGDEQDFGLEDDYPEDSYAYKKFKDLDNYRPVSGSTIYYPEEWQGLMEATQH